MNQAISGACESITSYMAFGRKATVATGKSLFGATGYALSALNTLNPVNLTVRYAPSIIATPVRYVGEEVQGFAAHLLNPRQSLCEAMEYFAKKPDRLARLLQALGVPIDPTTMTIFKVESTMDKVEKLFPDMLAGKMNMSKVTTSNVERLRGKIILSVIKALIDGGEDFTEDMLKYIPRLFMHSGERAVVKTLMKAAG
ncbi:hypothetical protein [Endozoicomonas sp. OPT23]|uniref:hypothetical protein n=1 Tax=Endozoicomonas sp. OPT23 TaxID=2072845 RepID=UPI00129A0F37|nr:hypothetical protein [Endozoicomonas sp. OPT23]